MEQTYHRAISPTNMYANRLNQFDNRHKKVLMGQLFYLSTKVSCFFFLTRLIAEEIPKSFHFHHFTKATSELSSMFGTSVKQIPNNKTSLAISDTLRNAFANF